jgi:hypothetical protein
MEATCLGQGLGTLFGLITAFAIAFLVMTFGPFMPEDLISSSIVTDFLSNADLVYKETCEHHHYPSENSTK